MALTYTLDDTVFGKYAIGGAGNDQILAAGPLTAGTDTITVTATDGSGWSKTKSIPITVTAVAAFSLDFTTGSLPSGVVASGGANGTVINASGVMVDQPAPRFDYLNGTCRGIFVEPGATNQFTSSSVFTGVWTKSGTLETAVATSNIDGGTVYDLSELATTAAHNMQRGSTSSSGAGLPFTQSWVVEYVNVRWVALRIVGSGQSGTHVQYFDLLNGVLGTTTGAPVDKGIEQIKTGVYRIWITQESTGIGDIRFDLCMTNADGSLSSYLGNTANKVRLHRAQREDSLVDTSPIRTTSTAVARTADLIEFTIPSGVGTLTYTFDDNSTQEVSVTPGAYAIPTTLNRRRIKTITGA